ncbi:hypothetical protein PF005_g1950 [Phytophthora fragariae]|uniref:Glycoside hydrolase family 3 C-terminal domain-containing protein n=1 Tax=Phytophthora fragariae TaxID=53985 RepID=A0A6A3ZHX0_9STRA|nr:hypothetical protein PF005_g1950 [Phytophthora fragariae]
MDDLLLGNNVLQGHLPVTYRASATAIAGTCTNTSVLSPFGYGISYTSFEYNNSNFAAASSSSSIAPAV